MMQVDPRDFTPEALSKIAAVCVECGGICEIAEASKIYPNRPDLWTRGGEPRWYWLCVCGAYVGAHAGTIKPLGKAANKATRDARSQAHAEFDPLWQKRMRISGLKQNVARGRGYRWLAAQMGLTAKECHIGELSRDQALRVVEICQEAKA